GKVPAELLAPMAAAEKRIVETEKANDKVFIAVRDRLFTRLYHEAFHAYLGTFVYPAREGTLPHWFNEGLAQIFETAIMEVGELLAFRDLVGKPLPDFEKEYQEYLWKLRLDGTTGK